MSVNTQAEDDMVYVATSSRNHQAKHAADSMLGRNYSGYTSDSHVTMAASRTLWDPQSGRMSTVRRTFCLLTTFDLILTFILWVIYTQLIGKNPIWLAFNDQVLNYQFKLSLFDTVMVAAARFTFIMLAYALFRIKHWWTIAITTTMTCVFLLVKCFLFEFNDSVLGGKNPLSYVLLIISFVLAWVETWMLDFKVIPHEQKLRDKSMGRPNERTRLLDSEESQTLSDDNREYYSPFHTPEGSDDENTDMKSVSSRIHSRKASDASMYSIQSTVDLEYYQGLKADAEQTIFELLEADNWKLEAGKSLEDGCTVHSLNDKKYGRKIFRLMGYVDMSPKELFTELVENFSDSPRWNPTILESRTLQIIDDDSDIIYSVAAEAAGGLVSARDFITIRHWKEEGGRFFSIAIGCKYPDMPVQKNYVRGENGPGGWVIEGVPGMPDKALFSWYVNSNLKGWLPQAVIDQALSSVLTDFYKYLLAHVADLKGE